MNTELTAERLAAASCMAVSCTTSATLAYLLGEPLHLVVGISLLGFIGGTGYLIAEKDTDDQSRLTNDWGDQT